MGISLGGILSVFGDIVYDLEDKTIRIENVSHLGYTGQHLSYLFK